MRAAICNGVGEALVIEEVTLVDPGPGEVRVRMKAVGVCHSDIAYAKGAWGAFPPAVFGHEAAGVVEAVGAGVDAVAPGDPAVVTLVRSCGACPHCAAGHPVRCAEPPPSVDQSPIRRAADGAPLLQAMSTGAFAEAVTVHQSQVVKAPASLPMETAAIIACAVLTGMGAAVNTAKVPEGADVVVIGVGGVGVNTVQAARLRGARRIIAVDIAAEKLAFATTLGATHGVDAADPTAQAQVMDLTDGLGASHVFVTVGARAATQSAFGFARTGGSIIWVGMPPSAELTGVDATGFAYRELTLLGSRMGSTKVQPDIADIIRWREEGRIELDRMVTGRFRFDDINAALASTERGEGVRNVILFE